MDYRLYLWRNEHIQAGQNFPAANDAVALEIGSIIYEACSDVVDGWEVWRGRDRVPPKLATNVGESLAEVVEFRQKHLAELEEIMQSSFACLRESRRLLDRLCQLGGGGRTQY